MKRLAMMLLVLGAWMGTMALDLTKAVIVYDRHDAPLVWQMAQTLADDIERVSGTRPQVATSQTRGANIVLATVKRTKRHRELRSTWERYAIDTRGQNLYITGSDPRGLRSAMSNAI